MKRFFGFCLMTEQEYREIALENASVASLRGRVSCLERFIADLQFYARKENPPAGGPEKIVVSLGMRN